MRKQIGTFSETVTATLPTGEELVLHAELIAEQDYSTVTTWGKSSPQTLWGMRSWGGTLSSDADIPPLPDSITIKTSAGLTGTANVKLPGTHRVTIEGTGTRPWDIADLES